MVLYYYHFSRVGESRIQTTNVEFESSQLIVYSLCIIGLNNLYDIPLVIIATVKKEIPIKIKHSEMNNAEQVKSVVLEGYGGYDKIKVSIFLICLIMYTNETMVWYRYLLKYKFI